MIMSIKIMTLIQVSFLVHRHWCIFDYFVPEVRILERNIKASFENNYGLLILDSEINFHI